MELRKIYINNESGFTLFEVLLVLSLLTVIVSMTLLFSINYYKSELLSAEHDNFVLLAKMMRSNSMLNKNESKHGIAIDPEGYKGYVLFEGSSFLVSNKDSRVYIPRNDDFTFSTDTPSYITFAQLSGDANYEGIFTLFDLSNNSSTINVNYEGVVF